MKKRMKDKNKVIKINNRNTLFKIKKFKKLYEIEKKIKKWKKERREQPNQKTNPPMITSTKNYIKTKKTKQKKTYR